jgi:hypothetical protein
MALVWTVIGLLLVLFAQAGLTWWLSRRLTSIFLQTRSEILRQADRQHESMLMVLGSVGQDLHNVMGQIDQLASQPPEHPLTGMAFLPTDQSSADLERQVKRAEDHAIQDGERIRFSSRPSGISEPRSSREPLTRRVPRSGPS